MFGHFDTVSECQERTGGIAIQYRAALHSWMNAKRYKNHQSKHGINLSRD